ncbi:hypothetical protein HAPAU_41590 [Halalkalicoccus paucihalophilus]|uniref:Uncharacterized protein n=1 Tax=Halalkalicoccus paucihalophilus TaxID=1008153 RepID=A0A151A949_9EURY|nr:hypothetical protein HAPAU_41590 [Halalkalicoccus paucihalophilus]
MSPLRYCHIYQNIHLLILSYEDGIPFMKKTMLEDSFV